VKCASQLRIGTAIILLIPVNFHIILVILVVAFQGVTHRFVKSDVESLNALYFECLLLKFLYRG
jgi:hypothetical protein